MARRLEHAAAAGNPLAARYALLVLDLPEDAAGALAARINAPSECRDLARLAIRERDVLAHADDTDAEAMLGLLERADLFRRPERLERLAQIAEADAPVDAARKHLSRDALHRALAAARGVDAGAIAREHPQDIPGAVRRARLAALAGLQPPTGH